MTAPDSSPAAGGVDPPGRRGCASPGRFAACCPLTFSGSPTGAGGWRGQVYASRPRDERRSGSDGGSNALGAASRFGSNRLPCGSLESR